MSVNFVVLSLLLVPLLFSFKSKLWCCCLAYNILFTMYCICHFTKNYHSNDAHTHACGWNDQFFQIYTQHMYIVSLVRHLKKNLILHMNVYCVLVWVMLLSSMDSFEENLWNIHFQLFINITHSHWIYSINHFKYTLLTIPKIWFSIKIHVRFTQENGFSFPFTSPQSTHLYQKYII